MKFQRKSKAREKLIDILAKSVLIAFSALVCLWMISGARAGSSAEITDIRQQELDGGTYAVDFLFSKPVAKEDVAVEFQRNFIQLTLKGISAYPARTTKLNHAAMEKVFTYQYQPDVTRARMLLKGQASAIQSFTTSEVEAQRVRILVKAGALAKGGDTLKTRAASANGTEAALDPEEEKLRKEIVAGQNSVAASAAAVGTAAATTATAISAPVAAKNEKPVDKESLPVFSSRENGMVEKKETNGAGTRMLTSLLLVIGLIAAGTLGFRKFAQGKGINLNLPFQKQARLIEVVSTTSVGGKRSIAIVKVMDQYLVVGMGEGGMNLLKDLGANATLDRHVEESTAGLGPTFSNTFQGVLSGQAPAQAGTGATARDVSSARAAINAAASAADGIVPGATSARASESIRSSIKKRLEGFKPL
jgi:flagellar biogenesis protein FliO